MSYQVLARRWRPREFGSLVGQEHVVRALRHALEQGRLHHAYLFTGTRGVGKTTLARILAKCLNCETGLTPSPCGRCSACLEIDAGRFVDLLEVDAATNTRVDEMRQLLETAQYAPTRGRFKVYVIDEVHMLSASAFNAMLKTLEEPPEHMKFILATTDPQKIPVTVLSRCLQFNLKQMTPTAIVGHLEAVLRQEGVSFDDAALAMISRAAQGSMRDALSLLDQAIAHGGGAVTAAPVSEMLGTIDRDHLVRLLEQVAAGDAAGAVALVDEMQARSLSFDAALADLATLLLRATLAQLAPGALADADDSAAAGRLAEQLDGESIQLYYQIALQGREDLVRAPDEHAGFLMTVLRMLAFRPETASKATAVKPARSASAPARSPAASASVSLPASVAAPQSPEVTAPQAPEVTAPQAPGGGAAPQAQWLELVQQLPISGAARELARNAELERRDDQAFYLIVPRAKAYLAERSYVDKLNAALDQHLGRAVRLNVALGEGAGTSAASVEARAREASRAQAVRAVQGDGFVQDLVNMFDGKVVDASIRVNSGESGK